MGAFFAKNVLFFPWKGAFFLPKSTTIPARNKAQGQTLELVGIYLPDHVFRHWQIYVALSRVHNSKAIAVHVNNKEGYTKNIVYKEVL